VSTRRGGSAENAVLRASRAYRRDGKSLVLVKQEPRIAVGGIVGTAPVDFLGVLDGRALAIEVKATKGKSLPVSRLRDEQVSLMGYLHNAGARVELLVHFSDVDEAYSVAWPEVVTFLALRWRESWPLAWFRAVGLWLPIAVEGRDEDRWRVLFLDGRTHPASEQAAAELERDKERAVLPTGDEQEEPVEAPAQSSVEPRTHEQIRAAVEDATREGIERAQHKQGRRWPARGRGGRCGS
jgi:penicillin-binding protein-related factor A (putative recombinase)